MGVKTPSPYYSFKIMELTAKSVTTVTDTVCRKTAVILFRVYLRRFGPSRAGILL